MVPTSAVRHVCLRAISALRFPPAGKLGINWYLALTLGFAVVWVSLVAPSLSIRAELLYETGTNFLPVAYHQPTLTGLTTPEAGYLPLLARLLAAITIKLLGCVKWYPVVVQYLAVLSAAGLSGLINLHVFRSWIRSDLVRFGLGLAVVGGLVSDVGLYAMFNVAYFGFLPLAALLTVRLTDVRFRTVAALAVVVPVVILSKGVMVLFGPCYAVYAIVGLYRRCWKSAVVGGLAVLATVGQVQTIRSQRVGEVAGRRLGVEYVLQHPAEFREKLVKLYHRAAPLAMVPEAWRKSAVVAGCLFGAWLIGAAIVRRAWVVVLFAVLATGLSLGSATLTVIGNPLWYVDSLGPMGHPTIGTGLLFLAALTALLASVFETSAVFWFAAVTLGFALARPSPYVDHWRDRDELPSQWRTYRKLLTDDVYAIPVNAEGWFIGRNVQHVGWDTPMIWTDVETLNLKAWNQWGPMWRIHAILADVPMDRRAQQPTHILALDDSGRVVARGTRITPNRVRFQYYLFGAPVPAVRWQFVGDDGVTPVTARAAGVQVFARMP